MSAMVSSLSEAARPRFILFLSPQSRAHGTELCTN